MSNMVYPLLIIIAAILVPAKASDENMQQLVNDRAAQIRQKMKLTAVGIGVLHRGEIVALATDGQRRRRGDVPVTIEDKWHVGSITKSMTATLIARMVEQGEFHFDTRLNALLPDLQMHKGWGECTLSHLLTHTSGLPANFQRDALSLWPENADELVALRRKLVGQMLRKQPLTPCGDKFVYSNIGYTIAGHIAELAADKPYETLLAEEVFVPLMLNSAGFGAPKGVDADEQPMGHQVIFGIRRTIDPFEHRGDNSPVISAAGRVHMSLGDLLAFGNAHLNGHKTTNGYLGVDTWQRLHQSNENDYAYGWVSVERDWADGTVLWHNGSNTMWYALLVVLPEKDMVMAFVTNDGAISKAEKAFFLAAKDLASSISS